MDYTVSNMDMVDDPDILMMAGAFIAAFFIVLFVIILVMYVFQGIGLMRIANRRGYNYSWLAWIPFGNMYLLGALAKNEVAGIVLALSGVVGVLVNVSVNVSLGVPVAFIVLIAAYYMLFKQLSTKAVLLTILTGITFGALGPIFLFAIRNNVFIEDTKEDENAITE